MLEKRLHPDHGYTHSSGAFFVNLTPLFTALLSSAFLGEAPQLFHALAFVLIVSGIVLSARRLA
jgi:drug/metabolite transporter (DMT)-like permease